MERREISSLDLAPSIKDLLSQRGLTLVRDLVEFRPTTLASYLNIDQEIALNILRSTETTPHSTNSTGAGLNFDVCEQLVREKSIVTFCKGIDDLLGGGVPVCQVTEFAGVPGIGKTQIAMQLALDVQIPEPLGGLGGRCLYIDTEGSLSDSLGRLGIMAQELVSHLGRMVNNTRYNTPICRNAVSQTSVESMLAGIDVIVCYTKAELGSLISKLDAYLQQNNDIKLVIIDSIAFPYRQLEKRNIGEMIPIMRYLQKAAVNRHVAIVTTNHLGMRYDKTVENYLYSPVLGDQWSHGVSNRLLCYFSSAAAMDTDREQGEKTGDDTLRRRIANLIKSTRMPCGVTTFAVTSKGIRSDDKQTTTRRKSNRHN